MLKLTKISHSYQYEQCISELSAEFFAGKVYTILGTPSSGKTTLVGIIGRMIVPDDGNIIYKGQQIMNLPRNEYAKIVSTTRHVFTMDYEKSVMQNLKSYLKIRESTLASDDENMLKLLAKAEISEKRSQELYSKMTKEEQVKIQLIKLFLDPTPIICIDIDGVELIDNNCESLLEWLIENENVNKSCILYFSRSEYIFPKTSEIWGMNKGKLLFVKSYVS